MASGLESDGRAAGRGAGRAPLLAIFFASGAAALVYEVLWLKELGQLFGVTAHAAATTLAVFFLGLSAGGLVWGRRAARIADPLRAYALLEVAIAASAMLYFFLLDLYRWLLPGLFAGLADRPGVFLLVKLALATSVLFPPAFFMGGTLPVMGQYLVRRADELGRTATLLYAVNTVGAAAGALAAGFVLPTLLGFRRSYLIAIAINLGVAAIALRWSRKGAPPPTTPVTAGELDSPAAALAPALLWTLAATSGFLTLALEVLWTRMFSQVLQNSVYTFAAILTVFLLALALGSGLAHALCRAGAPPVPALQLLLAGSGLLVLVTPFVFTRLNPGLALLGADLGWTRYVAAVFGGTLAVLLIPGVIVGSVFPLLLKLAEPGVVRSPASGRTVVRLPASGRTFSAGRTIGQLASVNTLAAILGSLAAGFVLLESMGLWTSTRLIAGVYLVLALWVTLFGGKKTLAAVPLAGLAVAIAGWGYGGLATVTLDAKRGEELVFLREGAGGTVAVVRRGDDLLLKVNNSYQLGTARATANQRFQAYLPLALHADPKSVFFLGLGTGISAGGALDFDVERVVVSELDRHVAEAARSHFAPYAGGLFDDPRARVVVEDGRFLLAAAPERYDVVIGDVFLTYRAGVGSLYTREHFEAVRERLEPGGLFAQWLPLFDLSERELGIIIRTMLEVFPQVTLWRRGFSPRYPVFALVAHADPEPLDAGRLRARLRRLVELGRTSGDLWYQNIPLAAYAGNPSATPGEFLRHPISTDDRRPLEYLSPITERDSRGAGVAATLTWLPLADFCARLAGRLPPARDPYLARLGPGGRAQVEAGLAFQAYEANRRTGRDRQAAEALRRYHRLVAAAQGESEVE